MSEWQIEYKRRRCGKIDRDTGSSESNCKSAVLHATLDGDCDKFGIPVLLVSVHTCDDGAHGVTDLVGCAPKAAKEAGNG